MLGSGLSYFLGFYRAIVLFRSCGLWAGCARMGSLMLLAYINNSPQQHQYRLLLELK